MVCYCLFEVNNSGSFNELGKSGINLAEYCSQKKKDSSQQISLKPARVGQAGSRSELVKKEEKEEGNVAMSVYMKYMRSGGIGFLLLILFGYLNRYISRVLFSLWLSFWSNYSSAEASSSFSSQSLSSFSSHSYASYSFSSFYSFSSALNEGIYSLPLAIVMGVQAFLVLYELLSISFTSIMWIIKGILSSRSVHSLLLYSLTSAPVQFFDT